MKKSPRTILGCPVIIGKLKRRVAKKRWRHIFNVPEDLAALDVGDWINDCSGFNRRIAKIEPDYYRTGGGWLLIDIQIVADDGACCSIMNCGVTPKVPRDQIEAEHLDFLKSWTLGPDGQTWFGPEWPTVAARTRAFLKDVEQGMRFTDEDGRKTVDIQTKYKDITQ